LKETIKKVIGGNAVIFDGGAGTARELKRRLAERNLENIGGLTGKVEFFNSNDSGVEKALSEKLFYL
jgi:glutamate racemase